MNYDTLAVNQCYDGTLVTKQTFCSIQLDQIWSCSHEQDQMQRRNVSVHSQ